MQQQGAHREAFTRSMSESGGSQGGQAIADGAAHGQTRVAALGKPHAVRAHGHPALIPHAAQPACVVSSPIKLYTDRL